MWDVFFSYSRGDAGRVRALVDALRVAGLKVFTDEAGVAGFAGISRTIRAELARSRALLAFYSAEYPQRQACQWELTAAYLAGLREGDPLRRVMVVNPERGTGHIHPVELRDARAWSWASPTGGGTGAVRAFVADVRAHLERVPGAMPLEADGADGSANEPPPWLLGPPPSSPGDFVGRLPELWRVHSALHAHAAPLVTGRSAARAVQIRGMAGMGKSLLAREYALRFGAAFPGGICWLDACGEGAYETGLRALERRLDTHDLYAYFEARGEPFLFVVDGLPGGLTPACAARFHAPHPLGRTLLTTRSRAYDALGVPVELRSLPPEHATELAGSYELAAEVGGHPKALALLGGAVRAGQDPRALSGTLYAPGDSPLDALAGEVDGAGFTLPLVSDAVDAGPAAMDVLRCAVALSPLPLTEEDAAAILAAVDSVPPAVARRRAATGISELRVRSLLSRDHGAGVGAGTGTGTRGAYDGWEPHPVTVHAWRHHDPAPARTEALRHAMLRTLVQDVGGRREARRMTTPPGTASTESERMAAFDIQVELVTRIGVQELEPGTGSLREALSSLHALFGFTRETLREYSISLVGAADGRTGTEGESGAGTGVGASDVAGADAPLTVQSLADGLLNRTLRPFTSAWHPRLAAYEALCPPGASPLDHEARWPEAEALREALAALRAPLRRIAAGLATISGADFGVTEAG